jgi:hypothetical protein
MKLDFDQENTATSIPEPDPASSFDDPRQRLPAKFQTGYRAGIELALLEIDRVHALDIRPQDRLNIVMRSFLSIPENELHGAMAAGFLSVIREHNPDLNPTHG